MIRIVLALGLGVSVLTGWFVGSPVRANKIEAKTRVKIQDRMILSGILPMQPRSHDALSLSLKSQQTKPKDLSRMVVANISSKVRFEQNSLGSKPVGFSNNKPLSNNKMLSNNKSVAQEAPTKPPAKMIEKQGGEQTPKNAQPKKKKVKPTKRIYIRKIARNHVKSTPSFAQKKAKPACTPSPFAHTGALVNGGCQ